MTDNERIGLAKLGKRLGKKALIDVTAIVTPETILGWYRRLVAKKYDCPPEARISILTRSGSYGPPKRSAYHSSCSSAKPTCATRWMNSSSTITKNATTRGEAMCSCSPLVHPP